MQNCHNHPMCPNKIPDDSKSEYCIQCLLQNVASASGMNVKFVDTEAFDYKQLQAFVKELMDMIPECPECGTNNCSDWLKKYVKTFEGIFGVISVCTTLINRAGGSVTITRKELMEQGGDTLIRAIIEDGEGNENGVVIRTKRDSNIKMGDTIYELIDKSEIEIASGREEEWPAEIHEEE